MLVLDVMTRQPLTVTGETTVKQAVTLLAERHLSALPVLDARGTICGIVSEADLIRDAFPHDARAQERPQAEPDRTASVLVRDVMTSPAISVHERGDLAEVVELMTSRRLKTLPVVDSGGQVVGMVSRSDVVRARARTDGSIAEEVGALFLALEHHDWHVEVQDGVVRVSGPDDPLDRSIAQATAGSVAGVVAVTVA